jgi:copper transport outer membrane protein MctB
VISFRYHLVSIVAVFLALAVGILVGTTTVRPDVIDRLKRTTDQQKAALDDLRSEAAVWNEFGKEIEPFLVSDRLISQQVVLVTAQGVDLGEIDSVQRVLTQAGAEVIGVIVATSRMSLPNEGARTDLADLLQTSSSQPPYKLVEEAAEALGRRLDAGAIGAGDDLLTRLDGAGFVDLQQRGGATTEDIGGPDQIVVVLSGGKERPLVDPSLFSVPLVKWLVTAGQPVGAAETENTAYPFVPLLRDDGEIDGRLVTVDNADAYPGRVALVMALGTLVQSGAQQGGDYGVKTGASGLLPTP